MLIPTYMMWAQVHIYVQLDMKSKHARGVPNRIIFSTYMDFVSYFVEGSD